MVGHSCLRVVCLRIDNSILHDVQTAIKTEMLVDFVPAYIVVDHESVAELPFQVVVSHPHVQWVLVVVYMYDPSQVWRYVCRFIVEVEVVLPVIKCLL